MRIDAQTKSLHYIQMCSVKDKIDLGKLSDVRPTGEKSLYNLLPSTEDFEKLNESFAVHVARVMVEYIPLKISAVLYRDTYPTNQSDTYNVTKIWSGIQHIVTVFAYCVGQNEMM